MWTLFTTALARGNSTTQVSIMNTSSNFVITAMLGFVIFSEALPPLWWLGAAMLVAGNVIIGSKDEGNVKLEDERREDGEETITLASDLGDERGPSGSPEGIIRLGEEDDDKDEDYADLRI
jgi:drug/metabolite transporter (DMT)-like permease